MSSARSTEEQWELLLVTLELGRHFELVFIAGANATVIENVRARLRYDCARQNRQFFEPDDGEDGLDWLTRLRGTAGESKGPLPVLFYRFPTEPEKELFVLHRLNENRDNLRNKVDGIRGMLVLAGSPSLLQTAAREAPDWWSVRSKAFEVEDLALPNDLPPAFAPALPVSPPAPVIEPSWRFDVFLIGAFRDKQAIEALRDALRLEGLNVAIDVSLVEGGVGFDVAIKESRKYVFALSSDLIHEVWPKVESLFEADPEGMRRRSIALLLRQCVPPAPLLELKRLDWTTAQNRKAALPELLQFLRPKKKRKKPPKINKRAEEIVVTGTEIYSPPWPWWKKLVAFVLCVMLVVGASAAYDKVTAAKKVFPEFGWGTVYAEATDANATRELFIGDKYVRLQWNHWISGDIKLVMKKFPGTGSVDLNDIVVVGSFDVTFEVNMFPGRSMSGPDHFDMVFIDTQRHEVFFACPTPTNYQREFFTLEWKEVEGVDPMHIERIELRMHKKGFNKFITFGAFDLANMRRNGLRRDATECKLVTDKDDHGPTPAKTR